MASVTSYPSCCSASAAIQFGQNFDSRGVQTVNEIKASLTASIDSLKFQVHHTVVTAIIIRMQKNAKKALEELGFKRGSGWMNKPLKLPYAEGEGAEKIRRDYANIREKYEAQNKVGKLTRHDYEYYAAAYSEKVAESKIAADIATAKELDADNASRATMLFYLPLEGEENEE